TRVGRPECVRAGKGYGKGAGGVEHHTLRILLRRSAGAGTSAKVPEKRQRDIIIGISAGASEVHTRASGDREVGRRAGNLTLWRIVDRDGTRGWRGINTSCCIGARERDGKSPGGREDDVTRVLHRRGRRYPTEIPDKGEGLVPLSIHTVPLKRHRR